MSPDSKVVVVGSANGDYTMNVHRLPEPGETVLARRTTFGVGGKGLNQAVAAAGAGVEVSFVGAVGADEVGCRLRDALEANGVDTTRLQTLDDVETGTAHIFLDDEGTNEIVVVPGANSRLSLSQISALASFLDDGDIVVLQGEIPADIIRAASRAIEQSHARLVLNLAPVIDVGVDTLALADPLVVNETEARTILHLEQLDGIDAARRAAARLAAHARTVIVTVGARGSVVHDSRESYHVPAPTVDPVVDTTGAGDAFVGVLAAGLARGHDLLEAARMASVAASATTTRSGASASYGVIASVLDTTRAAGLVHMTQGER